VSRQADRANARRKVGDGASKRRDPGPKGAAEKTARLPWVELCETRIDTTLDRSLSQQVGAESVNGADEGTVEVLPCFRCHRRLQVFQLLANAQFHFTGCLMRKDHRRDSLHADSPGQGLGDRVERVPWASRCQGKPRRSSLSCEPPDFKELPKISLG
jgi:hypothetical protein